MGLIVGFDDFGEVITEKLNFIDKSLFIKEILDNKDIKVTVIVRPRRFGKTLNLSMLHHFLAAEANMCKTQGMFDNLDIAQQGEIYMQEQGKYPVIFITFKSIKDTKLTDAYDKLWLIIKEAYREHRYLMASTKLDAEDKEAYQIILKRQTTNKSLLEDALKNLTRFLYLHHGVKPWLLIDEYDTPIQSGYLNGYYDEIIGLMRGVFGSALKGNANIHRAVITGILRIAKEDLFSGVNNLKVFSVLNARYSNCFGFTEAEVDVALKKNGLVHLSTAIKTWYNGYQIGNSQIYNPWSIANCIDDQGLLKPYWVHTSNNDLIKQTMARADAKIKMQFEAILQGKSVTALVDENITFADLNGSGDKLWTLLLFAGYLTSTQTQVTDFQYNCLLSAPNKEVALLYPHIISSWFSDSLSSPVYHALLEDLTTGNLEDFLDTLQTFLAESASYFDVSGKQPEKFYHGLVMGLIVSLADTHFIQSNKESGKGRYDVLLIPKDPKKLGLILEFKMAKTAIDLEAVAQQALTQINERSYAAELQQKGIKNILKVGLAFHGKEVALTSSTV